MSAGAAEALLVAFDGNRQIAPLSESAPLTLDRGYAVAAEIAALRQTRGERPVGRKIGFTNRTIWPIYNVDAPIWGWVWDGGLHEIPADGRVRLPRLPEPRIEPEIVFGFRATPEAGMSVAALHDCLDWVAPGVEIVSSPFPGWRFTAADSAAAQGLHGSLWLGPKRPAAEVPIAALEAFTLTLDGPDTHLTGQAHDVLDGPLHALAHLLGQIARMPGAGPIRPGEAVTTGTLTDARPVRPGQRWRTRIAGAPLAGLDLILD